MERIESLLAKGAALTARDVTEIKTALALMPLDDSHAIEPWVWEGVERIVSDPDYLGDATL